MGMADIGAVFGYLQKQIPFGDDRKKSNGKDKSKRPRDAQPHLSYLLIPLYQIEWN
jgi:hypothetical protein